jgi:signal transduction histidine kinase
MSDSMNKAPKVGAKRRQRLKVPVLYTVLLAMFSGIAISEIRVSYHERDFRRAVIQDARAWQKVDRSVVDLFLIGLKIDRVDSVTIDSDQDLAQANAALSNEIRKLEAKQLVVRSSIMAMLPQFPIPAAPTVGALESLKKVADQLGISVHQNLLALHRGDVELRQLQIDGANGLVVGYNDAVLRVSTELEKFRIASIELRAEESAQAAKSTLWLGWIGITVIPLALVLGFMIMRRDKRISRAKAQALEEVSRREVQLRAIARQLTESNRDLQDFAHVASHDLQEPLRKIVAFGDRMRTKHGEAMAPEAIDYLDRMQSSAARMQTLIQDLLSFSRVNAKSEPFREVDLHDIALGVASDLEIAVERTGGRLTVGELPHIEADPTQMRQLLQNLISNALKFRQAEVAPEIAVSATIISSASPLFPSRLQGSAEARWCRLTVSDNGIGFDEKYLDRIFKVFQRLHGRTEFEGSGIGLSVCRRIAERHNGDITATSVPGNGTTFILTLPVKQVEERSLLLGPLTSQTSDLVEA